MRPGSFKSLLDDAACQREALNAVGEQLRSVCGDLIREPIPAHLMDLLQRLAAAERHRG